MQLWAGGPVTLPARVAVDGYAFTVGSAPIDTAKLIDLIAHGDWFAIIPGMVDEETYSHLITRVMRHTEPLELADLWKAATDLAGRLAGTGSWWAAKRLLGTAVSDWITFDGWCLKRGFSPLDAPLWRVTSAMYTMMRDQHVVHGKPDQTTLAWEKLHAQLWMAPATAPRSVPLWTPADEAAAFARSMAALGPGG